MIGFVGRGGCRRPTRRLDSATMRMAISSPLTKWCRRSLGVEQRRGVATMAMGRQGGRQGRMIVLGDEPPKSPGHVSYDRLQAVLIEAGFDAFVEQLCEPYYALVMGAPSLPLGR
jgi:hypothetical protein